MLRCGCCLWNNSFPSSVICSISTSLSSWIGLSVAQLKTTRNSKGHEKKFITFLPLFYFLPPLFHFLLWPFYLQHSSDTRRLKKKKKIVKSCNLWTKRCCFYQNSLLKPAQFFSRSTKMAWKELDYYFIQPSLEQQFQKCVFLIRWSYYLMCMTKITDVLNNCQQSVLGPDRPTDKYKWKWW